MTLDPESLRIVLDLADARLRQLRAERPASENSIGQLAFGEVAAAVGWTRYPEGAPTA